MINYIPSYMQVTPWVSLFLSLVLKHPRCLRFPAILPTSVNPCSRISFCRYNHNFNHFPPKMSQSTSAAAEKLPKKLYDASRQLVKILRHKIVDIGLSCDSRGFVSVRDLFANRQSGMSRFNDLRIPEDLERIVESNEKKRLEIECREDGQYYIRAVQGHSANVGERLDAEQAFESITKPLEFCAHGTEERFADSIMAEGLKRMSRQHIHLVAEIHEDRQVSGYKKKSNAVVVIDMAKCLRDGMKFVRAANGVILTEGFDGVIPPEYIKEIIAR